MIRYEDIQKIAAFLKNEGYDKEKLCINIEVPNKGTINKINEDLFYRLGHKGTPIDCEQINAVIEGIKFTYHLPTDDKSEE